MRSVISLAALLAALVAGAAHSQTAAQPGANIQMIDTRRAHVVFTGRGGEAAVRRAAMQSAAALTLDQRGTWFRVDTEWVDDHGAAGTTVALEVKFGEGPTPQEANAFDATEVTQTAPSLLQASR